VAIDAIDRPGQRARNGAVVRLCYQPFQSSA